MTHEDFLEWQWKHRVGDPEWALRVDQRLNRIAIGVRTTKWERRRERKKLAARSLKPLPHPNPHYWR